MADEDEETIPKKPLFVLGAGGFVGGEISRAFVQVEDEEGWEVTGTLRPGTAKPKWLAHVVEPTEAALAEAIAKCSVIVLDLVMEPELSELVLQLLSARTAGEDESEKTVIGISTIMTWARTSPPVVEEGEEPLKLTEDEYKRRRPHVNFADQHTLEKLVVKSASSTVRTHVVCAGLVYGGAEELFHPLFKLAWHNQPVPLLALAGGGANVLPTIHVRDLSSIVLKVAEGGAPKFIVAVDAAREQTLLKITQAVAKQLGTGELAMPERDEVLLEPSLDYLQLHLPIEPTSVLEMGFEWVSQAGLARNMAKMVGEFRAARRVEPLKLLLAGTLAGVNGCLESQLAAAIAAEYRVERVTTAALVAAALGTQSELSDKVRAAKAADKQNTGNLPDELMVALVRAKLNSAECSNQGYVLDGFPQTLPQLRLLAPEKVDGEEEEEAAADDEEGEADVPKPGVDCTPEHVLVVRSADDQLKQRVQAMAQPQVEATGMTADQLLKRMQFWVQANAPEGPNNLLMHKAVKQLEPLELDADALPLDAMLKRVRIALGKPRNYGPTEAEVAAKEARLVALKAEEEAKAMTLAADRLKAETEERERLRVAEAARAADRLQHEKALLESRSAPLRAYLMSEVIPTLTEGLIEVTKVRPEDPVDFLAEWIFKKNPSLD